MATEAARALSSSKKRGVVKASLTSLGSRLDAVEHSANLDEAQHLTARLETLVAELKVHHYSIINLLDDDDDLERLQEVFEEHEDDVAQLTARLEKLVTVCSAKDSSQSKIAFKQLKVIEKGLANVLSGASSLLVDDAGVCLLQQYEEQQCPAHPHRIQSLQLLPRSQEASTHALTLFVILR